MPAARRPCAYKTVTVLFCDVTDSTVLGDALSDLAEVLGGAGRAEDAEALGQALERYEWKKNLAMVAQVRSRLDPLRGAAPPARSSS